MLKVRLNGKEEDLKEATTLAELIALKKLNPETIIVEHNHDLVGKEAWDGLVLKENDKIEILRFVGGG